MIAIPVASLWAHPPPLASEYQVRLMFEESMMKI
jgi:hypothetical protein